MLESRRNPENVQKILNETIACSNLAVTYIKNKQLYSWHCGNLSTVFVDDAKKIKLKHSDAVDNDTPKSFEKLCAALNPHSGQCYFIFDEKNISLTTGRYQPTLEQMAVETGGCTGIMATDGITDKLPLTMNDHIPCIKN